MVKTSGSKTIQWDDVRQDIQRLYVKEGQRLEDVRLHLRRKKRFQASIRSYRSKIREWGFKRNSGSCFASSAILSLELALRRRGRDYASQRQVSATRIVRMLLEAGADASSLYAQFLEPWKSRKDWGDFISEDEKECLFFFIQAGLDLNTRFPAPALGEENDPEATLGHVLLFHLPGLSMDSFLAQRLTPQPGGNGAGLLPELMNGCRQRPEHVPAAEIVDTLLCRGADRAYSERWGLTSLGILIRTIVERPSHDNMEEEISLLKALLGTPGADPGFPETWSPDCSCPMDRVLSNSSFVHSYPLFAVRVLQTLLERLPDAMTKAPQWQQQSKFLPATENFRDYRLGKTFHLELKTHALLDEFEAEAFLAAAQIVALRQFVELQFSKQREVRNNTDIYFAQKALMHYGVAPVEFPRDLHVVSEASKYIHSGALEQLSGTIANLEDVKCIIS
ncbi:hypothetical protein SLS57_005721 [Botryosphaeria dothidea]